MKNAGFTQVEFLMIVLLLVGIYGWIANIIAFIAMDFNTVTLLLVARAAGIFIAPLGVVLGFVP